MEMQTDNYPKMGKILIRYSKINPRGINSERTGYLLATDFDISSSSVHHLEVGRKARRPTTKFFNS